MEITGNEIDKEYLFDRDWKNDYFDNKIIYVGQSKTNVDTTADQSHDISTARGHTE